MTGPRPKIPTIWALRTIGAVLKGLHPYATPWFGSPAGCALPSAGPARRSTGEDAVLPTAKRVLGAAPGGAGSPRGRGRPRKARGVPWRPRAVPWTAHGRSSGARGLPWTAYGAPRRRGVFHGRRRSFPISPRDTPRGGQSVHAGAMGHPARRSASMRLRWETPRRAGTLPGSGGKTPRLVEPAGDGPRAVASDRELRSALLGRE